MAVLTGRDPRTGGRSIRLAAIRTGGPSAGDADLYELSVSTEAGGAPWTSRYSTEGWNPDDIWYVARAFAHADAVTGATIPADVWGTGRLMPAAMSAGVDWLHCTIVALRKRGFVRCLFFAQDGDDAASFRRIFLQAAVEDVMAFGKQLEREIIAASPEWAAERGFT